MKKTIISKHLDSVLRDLAAKGKSVLLDVDMKELVLLGFVTLKILRGWTVSKEGLEYLKENPYYAVPLKLSDSLEEIYTLNDQILLSYELFQSLKNLAEKQGGYIPTAHLILLSHYGFAEMDDMTGWFITDLGANHFEKTNEKIGFSNLSK